MSSGPDSSASCPHDSVPARLRRQRRHRAAREAELARARARLFMSASDPIVLIDVDGRYLDMNEAACRQLGYTRAELLGMTVHQINGVSEETWQAHVAETIRLGSRVVETRYHCRSGRVVPVEVNVSTITYQGRPAFLSVARNVERRKSAEAELVRRNLELASLAAGATRNVQSLATSGPSLRAIDATSTFNSLLPAFIEQAYRLVAFDDAVIALYLPQTAEFVARLDYQDGVQSHATTLWPCAPAFLELLRQALPVLLPDGGALRNLGASPSPNGHSPSQRGMVLPLLAGDQLVGALSIGRRADPGFTRRDADDLCLLTSQLMMAIDSSAVLDEIRALAISEERSRLSRELHDRVGQALAGAAAYSAAASELLGAGRVDKAVRAVEQVSNALQQAYADLREALCALRSAEVAPDDWVRSLQQYANYYEQQWGIRCELQVGDGVAAACGAEGRVILTRILQEALANVRKHAQSKRAWVSIRLEDGSVLACVTDRGQGFDPANRENGHYGLDTMRERARSLGGDLDITSGASGTQVRVRVPARYTA